MLRKKFQDRCSNPFKLGNHKSSKGLRKVAKNLREIRKLSEDVIVCPNCRIKLSTTSPTLSADLENETVHMESDNDQLNSKEYVQEIDTDENEDSFPQNSSFCYDHNIKNNTRLIEMDDIEHSQPLIPLSFDTDHRTNNEQLTTQCSASFCTTILPKSITDLSSINDEMIPSQASSLSQISLDDKLPNINEALQVLNNSPIPRKKLKSENWINNKVEKVSYNLRKSLRTDRPGVYQEIPSDAANFQYLIEKLKNKFNSVDVDKSQKLQILTLLPPSWSVSKICSTFGTTRYMAQASKKLFAAKGMLSSPDKTCGKRLSDETKKKVIEFYEDSRNSATMPGKKDYISVQNEHGQRTHVQKKLILSNLTELYEKYCEENSAGKIDISMFASLRPRHCVLAGAAGTHAVCVCAMHQNVKLMLIGSKLQLESSVGHVTTYRDCIQEMVCANSLAECHVGKCGNCPGTTHLRNAISLFLAQNEIDEIRYKQWVSSPRASLETFIKSSEEFVEDFCDKMKSLTPHAYVATMQGNFMKNLKNSLQEHECLVICDFAENYSFVIQNATPAYHWNNRQATVYTVVIYFHNQHKSLSVVSDCLSHDSIAVHIYTRIVNDYIQSINDQVTKVYYFSDGAPQQYKNFKNIVNLCHHKADFGVDAEWHFFATAHGKGPCDGIGGTLKREAARTSLQRPHDNQITTPEELFAWASQTSTLPNIAVKFSPVTEYANIKPKMEKRFANSRRIPSLQKVHCVIPQNNGSVMVKDFSSSTEFRTCSMVKSAV